jgi:hypothetical protein
MSMTSQGPGWWFASDGRWYPPESWTGPPQQAPPVVNPGMPMAHYPYAGAPYVMPRQTNGLAIASLVCSCAGIVLFGIPAVLGIIFGFVARSQIKRTNGMQAGAGLALSGIIVGFCIVAMFILLVVLIAVFGHTNTCFNTPNQFNCSVN